MNGIYTRIAVNYKKMDVLAANINLEFLVDEWSTPSIADGKCELLERIMIHLGQNSRIKIHDKRHKIVPDNVWRVQRRLKNSISRSRKRIYNVRSNVDIEELPAKIKSLNRINSMIRKLRRAHKLKDIKKQLEESGEWSLIKRHLGKEFFEKCKSYDDSKTSSQLTTSEEDFMKDFSEEIPPYRNVIHNLNEKRTGIDPSEILKKITKRISMKKCVYDEHLSCKTLSFLLKNHGVKIIGFMLNCIEHGYTPQYIKRSRISLIPKACGTKLRPIVIMNPLYRLFDLLLYLITKNKIKKWWRKQFAFREDLGTLDLIRSVKFAIESTNNEFPVVLIPIDLKNAFENVTFQAIFLGLINAGVTIRWALTIIQHIKGRLSMVKKRGKTYWKRHHMGTPQGGFLSPIIFSLATSILEKIDGPDFDIYLHADDMFILAKGSKNMEPWLMVEKKIAILSKLLKSIGLEINPTKSKVVLVKTQAELRSLAPNSMYRKFHLEGTKMNMSFDMNILGIEIYTTIAQLLGDGKISARNQWLLSSGSFTMICVHLQRNYSH